MVEITAEEFLQSINSLIQEEKMDAKLIKSEKAKEGKTKKEFKGLLKEDKKLDAKRDSLEKQLKKKK